MGQVDPLSESKLAANIYLFKVNNRDTRKRCEICSKLTIKTPERRHWLWIYFIPFSTVAIEQVNVSWGSCIYTKPMELLWDVSLCKFHSWFGFLLAARLLGLFIHSFKYQKLAKINKGFVGNRRWKEKFYPASSNCFCWCKYSAIYQYTTKYNYILLFSFYFSKCA